MNEAQNTTSKKDKQRIKELEIENALLKQRLLTILNIANLEKGYWFNKSETHPDLREVLALNEEKKKSKTKTKLKSQGVPVANLSTEKSPKECFGCVDNFTCSQEEAYDYCANCAINGQRQITPSPCSECDGSGLIKFPQQAPRRCKLCSLKKHQFQDCEEKTSPAN